MTEARSRNIYESNRIHMLFSWIGSGVLIRCLCMLILVAVLLQYGCSKQGDVITVGSKNFTEQVILGELLASHIEAKLGVPVDRRLNLAGTFLCHQAVVSGELDLYVEYTGTAFTGILGHEPSGDQDGVLRTVMQEYADRFDLEWTEPLGFNNTFAIMVRGEDARKLGLQTILDAAAHTPNWRAGFGYEFMERADGFQGLAAAYGLAQLIDQLTISCACLGDSTEQCALTCAHQFCGQTRVRVSLVEVWDQKRTQNVTVVEVLRQCGRGYICIRQTDRRSAEKVTRDFDVTVRCSSPDPRAGEKLFRRTR